MRITFNGKGDPIPEIALPAPGEAPDSFSQSFMLEDGVDFVKAPYVDLGYTNYEVWCVGAAGGRGGHWMGNGPAPFCAGGAGGGGGMHRFAGLLADLPDEVPVNVGQAGVDGTDSNSSPPYVGQLNAESQFDYVLDEDGYAIDLPILDGPSYVGPVDGADGETSSFGSVCQASGGKGGQAAQRKYVDPFPLWGPGLTGGYGGLLWFYYFVPGEGGDGGKGDEDLAGGADNGGHVTHTPYAVTFGPEVDLVGPAPGVPRSRTHSTPFTIGYTVPEDGRWNGSVGAGGGGSHGGRRGTPSKNAVAGSRGSMNFVDTSAYGPGQSVAEDGSGALTIPGGGGGAKAKKLLKYGSHAQGFDPKGVVFIRLYKLV